MYYINLLLRKKVEINKSKFSIKMLIVMIITFFIAIYTIVKGFYWILVPTFLILIFSVFKKLRKVDIDEKGKNFIINAILITSVVVLLDMYSTYRLITIETLHFEGNGIFVFLYPKLLNLTYPILFLIAMGVYTISWVLVTKTFEHRSRWIVFSIMMMFHSLVVINNFLF